MIRSCTKKETDRYQRAIKRAWKEAGKEQTFIQNETILEALGLVKLASCLNEGGRGAAPASPSNAG